MAAGRRGTALAQGSARGVDAFFWGELDAQRNYPARPDEGRRLRRHRDCVWSRRDPQRLGGRSDGRHHLCRRARRLRVEPGACRRRRRAQAGAGRQSHRGGERSRDRRRRQNHGIDDQPRRSRPHPGDIVRLLLALRRRQRPQIPGGRVSPRGAFVEQGQGPQERRLLFRLPQRGALHRRRRGGTFDQDRKDRLRRGQADFPACSPTSIACCWARVRSIPKPPCR